MKSQASLYISKGFLEAALSLSERGSVRSSELSAQPSRLIVQLLSLLCSLPRWRWGAGRNGRVWLGSCLLLFPESRLQGGDRDMLVDGTPGHCCALLKPWARG